MTIWANENLTLSCVNEKHALGTNFDLCNVQTNDKIMYSKIKSRQKNEKDKDSFLLCLSIINIQIGAQRVPIKLFIMGRHKRKMYALKLSHQYI